MRYFLFIAFVVVPVLEITLFLQVGSLIGVPATIALILLTAITGAIVVRSQGLQVLSKIRQSIQQGQPPVDALIQGACVLVAGLLLLTPGFATDALGFSLLIPPVRSFITTRIWKLIEPHVVTTTVHKTSWRENTSRQGTQTTTIEGEAVEIRDETDKPSRGGNMTNHHDRER